MVALSWMAAAPSVRAADVTAAPELPVEVSGCADEIATALPPLVRLEIDVLVRERGPTRAPPERIAIRCAGATAHVEVALTGARRAASLDLGALAPEHAARAVALAAAELVDAMSTAPPAPPVTPTPAVRDVPAPEGPARGPALFIGALAEWLGQPKQALFGFRLALHFPVGAVVVPALSVDGSFGDFPSGSAEVSARTLGAAAHVYLGTSAGKLRFAAGPGARIGWIQLRGQVPAGSTLEGLALSAAWGGPELRARMAYAPFDAGLLALELGAGLVALPVRGLVDGDARVYSIEGGWLSACAQAGIAW
jgi:hypothetical protein